MANKKQYNKPLPRLLRIHPFASEGDLPPHLQTNFKDNGIDTRGGVPVVYIRVHEGTPPRVDMPLDLIFDLI